MSRVLPPGHSGAGKAALEMAQRLTDAGEVAYTAVTGGAGGPTSPPRSGGIEVIRLSSEWMGGLALYTRLALCILRRRRRIDLLHAVTVNGFSLVAVVVARILGIPSILESTLSGDIYPRRPIATRVRRTKFRVWWWAIGRADRVVCRSPGIERECERTRQPIEVRTIPYGVDTERFRPVESARERRRLREELGIPLDRIVFLFVGGIRKRKGVDRLIEAFADLTRGDDSGCHLVLVGPTEKYPAEFVAGIRTRIEETGTARSVTPVLRYVEDVVDYMRAADAFVLPTRNEGFPIVVLEAMSCGLPVVVTRIPGVTDLQVREPETGYLVDDAGPEAFADALRALTRRLRAGEEFRGAARRRVVGRFSASRRDGEFLECCRRVLSHSRSGR